MLSHLRTIAILMLLAGISLGVFASRALRALGPGDLVPPTASRTTPRIELLVEHYQRDHQLAPPQADAIRRVLVAYDREVRGKLLELRQQHAPFFEELTRQTEEQIAEILAASR